MSKIVGFSTKMANFAKFLLSKLSVAKKRCFQKKKRIFTQLNVLNMNIPQKNRFYKKKGAFFHNFQFFGYSVPGTTMP